MFARGPSGFIRALFVDDHTSIEKSLNSVYVLIPYLSYLDCEKHFSLKNILIADENMHFMH